MPITTPHPRPPELAAVDLGSNTFHMIIARVVDGALQTIGHLKQRVQLINGLDQQHNLSPDAIDRGLKALGLFAERLQGFAPAQVRIVGTHALRRAKNAAEFVKRAEKIIPYPIEIISGHEEARLIFMGMEHTQPEKGRKLVIDIGGGSTELVIGENFIPQIIESQPMGCLTFGQLFFPHGAISAQHFRQAQLAASQKLECLASSFRLHGWDVALGASGTIKVIQQVLQAQGVKDGLITRARLEMLCQQVLQHTNMETLTLPALTAVRKALFVPGLAILCGIVEALAIDELRLSIGALREGVLYEMESRFRHKDIRSRTAQSLANQYHIDHEQAQRVRDTIETLYPQWQAQNEQLADPQLAILLKWAALLHEVGLNINHSSLHRHSAYILQHSNLPGFNQEQQLLIATLVRYHRKAIKITDLPQFSLYRKKHYLPLIQLLRLAVLLNNQRQATSRPPCLRLNTNKHQWTLSFPADWLQQNALVKLDLQREQSHWNAIEGWQLVIVEC